MSDSDRKSTFLTYGFTKLRICFVFAKQEWTDTAVTPLHTVKTAINFMFVTLSSIVEVNGGDRDTAALFILSLVYSNPAAFFVAVIFVCAFCRNSTVPK